MSSSVESALVVLVPEAETLVSSFRDKHDPAAAIGVPAHITLLYPFRAPNEIGATVIGVLRACFAQFAPFRFSFDAVRRLPGVLYLAPDPDKPFRQMTSAIWERCPETPPYGGRHSEIVPHLCVAQVADEQQLDRIGEEFTSASRGKLPIRATAAEVTLMDNRSGRWQVRAEFRLGSD